MIERILFSLGGMLLGAGITALLFVFVFSQPSHHAEQQVAGVQAPTIMDHSQMSMNEMSTSLIDKTGDAFDSLFIDQMIVHHQGAIEMAILASTSAKHQEIKELSTEIITAQQREISQMKEWQKAWGYQR